MRENTVLSKKNKIKKEGSQLTTICSQLKIKVSDGKMREADDLDTKGILSLIESVPSPKVGLLV